MVILVSLQKDGEFVYQIYLYFSHNSVSILINPFWCLNRQRHGSIFGTTRSVAPVSVIFAAGSRNFARARGFGSANRAVTPLSTVRQYVFLLSNLLRIRPGRRTSHVREFSRLRHIYSSPSLPTDRFESIHRLYGTGHESSSL